MKVLTLFGGALVATAITMLDTHPNISLFTSMGALLVLMVMMTESLAPYLASDDKDEDE